MRRFWIYQKERFPVFANGALILAFSSCAVCFSALLRGAGAFPVWRSFVVAFASSFISFFHLRVADEFKDFDEDSRFRPYRPVPRGLVKLKELAWLGIAGGAAQAALAWWLDARVMPWLLVTWIYFALMSREFFCRRWLKAHPFTYMWSHMFIMPLVDFYATSCDWRVASDGPPKGLFLFVAMSYLNGFVIEIGRKLRAPADEEHGVETYTALWGRKRAVALWLGVMAATGVAAVAAARQLGFVAPAACALALLFCGAALWSARFLRSPANGKIFEAFAGAWTLCLYLMLGAAPMLRRIFS